MEIKHKNLQIPARVISAEKIKWQFSVVCTCSILLTKKLPHKMFDTSVSKIIKMVQNHNLNYISFMCVCWRPEGSVGSPGAGVKSVCELLDMGVRNQIWLI